MFTSIAYAAGNLSKLDELLFKLNAKIINPLIEFSFIIALVIFLYGVMQFIRGAEKSADRETGKQHMIWGIVGFLIMLGVYAIISITTRTLGITGVTVNNKEQKFEPPCIQSVKIDGKDVGSVLPCKK